MTFQQKLQARRDHIIYSKILKGTPTTKDSLPGKNIICVGSRDKEFYKKAKAKSLAPPNQLYKTSQENLMEKTTRNINIMRDKTLLIKTNTLKIVDYDLSSL